MKDAIVRVHTRVRKDGAINITAKARQALGLSKYREVDIEVRNGTCIITPDKFDCRVCGKFFDDPLDDVGICDNCNAAIISALANRKVKSVAEAIDAAKVIARKNKPGRKV